MAIRQFNEDPPPVEPLCALKVGSFNCFCMWSQNGPIDEHTVDQLTNGSLSPGRSQPPLPHADARKHIDDSTDAGSETTACASAANGEASSMESAIAHTAALLDHPLLTAVRLNLGQQSPLQRELNKLANSGGDSRNMDAVLWEQVRRLATQHEEALGISDFDPSEWGVLELSGDNGLQFGSRNVNGTIHWFRSMDCPESDVVKAADVKKDQPVLIPYQTVVKAFASFLEVDLCAGFVKEQLMAEPLGMHTAKRDSVWRTVMQETAKGVKQDNIWVQSAVDALDEPCRSLLVFSSTTQRPPGLLMVPPPMAGFNRAEFECTITRLQPLRLVDGQSTGFRLTQTGVSRPLGQRGPGPSMPTIEESSQKTKQFFNDLQQSLDRRGRLDQRMGMSPRTELYERVRKHLVNLPS